MSIIATRNTNQRRVILETLRQSHAHLTADDIYVRVRKTLPNISLGTVYRNLSFLSECGEVRMIYAPGGSSFFDGNMSPHKHMLCKNCGCLIDIPDERCEVTISGMPPDIQILSYDILVHCVCADCAKMAG